MNFDKYKILLYERIVYFLEFNRIYIYKIL